MATTTGRETAGETRRQDDAEAQLPLFGGFKLYGLEIALAGSVDLRLTEDDSRSIEKALKPNGRLLVTLDIPGHPRPVQFDAIVEQRSYKLRRNPDTETREPITTARIKLDPPDED